MKNLIKYPINNYQFTLVLVLLIVVLAINSILTMPRAEDPELKSAEFPVIVAYPGTSPKDMEQLVVNPLESRFYALDGIKKIHTSINNGLAIINVEYKHGEDYDSKYQELLRELGAAQRILPANIYSAEVLKVDPSGVSVIQSALISENASLATMKRLSDDLKLRLEKVTSLKDVQVSGLPDQLIRIDIQQAKLAALRIPLNRIIQAVQSENQNIPAGSVEAGGKSFSVKTSGNYQSVEQLKNTIISSVEGKSILLREVAEVYPSFAAPVHITRLNGYRAVLINAAQKAGMNSSVSQKDYQKVIAEFRETLPPNVDFIVNFDQAVNVNNRLNGLGIDFMIAISLVLFTLLPLGIRASIVVMIAIPLSLGLGLITLNFLGYTLNQLSIVGFVVALGLVVDDSIVVVENIERWMREGYSRVEAAIKGTSQIALAVLGCTVTLVIAFLPLLFMPEIAGDFIRSMPVAVIASVLASFIVALFFVPFLSSILLKAHPSGEGNRVLRGLKKLIHLTYSRWLDKALKHPKRTLLIAAAIFLGAIGLIPVIGLSLFPASEKPQFMIAINTPLQGNINLTDSLTRAIEKDLKEIDAVQYFTSNVAKGNPRVYYNMLQASENTAYADIFVQLHPSVKAHEKSILIEQLRQKWDAYLGAKIEVKDFEQGVPMLSPVEVRLAGESLDTLQVLAARVEEILKQTPGSVYVNNPIKYNKTDLRLQINRDKAMALGVPAIAIDQTVRMALAGYDIGTFTDPQSKDNSYAIKLTVPRDNYPTISVFDDLFVDNMEGVAIPLDQLATLGFEHSPANIYHRNKERTVAVNSFVAKGYHNDDVIQAVIKQMDRFDFPKGYSYTMGGYVESREAAFGGFEHVIILTIFLFIGVLILEFKTFKSTLIVLSVIPLGIVGAVLALLFTGNSLSFVATIGLIGLVGIEVKNTILLVDFINKLRSEGLPLHEAIEQAGEIRFLPIILTSLTAIGGLIPIACSSNPLISPLAIVMIGGLISSTLLSRIVTPVIYKLMPPVVEVTAKNKSQNH